MDPQRRFLNKFLDEVLAGVAGAEEEEGGVALRHRRFERGQPEHEHGEGLGERHFF